MKKTFKPGYIKINQLISILRELLDKIGGTGVVGYSNKEYIDDVVKEWSVTEEKLEEAIKCFRSLTINQSP